MPPKSKLGQNFLNDRSAITRIVAALGATQTRTVVEVGPGAGAITELLAAQAKKLITVEVDHQLAIRIQVRFENKPVEVVEQDVLHFDFTAAAEAAGEKLLVVGNLPYYITSPILHRLAEHSAAIEYAVLMVQREVADRVAAHPCSRDYGLLSVTTQMFGPVERLFTLPPEAFDPPPEVHSTVFRWRFAPRFTELGIGEADFLRLAQVSFAQKRKTLANNLRAAGLTSAEAAEMLQKAEIDPLARAEALPLEAFARLAKIYPK
ncbi:16S rRNA (adenine(1518)-N(6)/adenine(1519)-N(6))-dimethyltransferase RsmA [Telmatobacter bradus]|uniref:16S rRNA (adenine(1518)-N(6)/adenine(1519)-N(6))- dimethyltransferase RsmA n=1 Tax=Telmatobacter bradus TaxID=474953 RepID=UPI003B430D2F